MSNENLNLETFLDDENISNNYLSNEYHLPEFEVNEFDPDMYNLTTEFLTNTQHNLDYGDSLNLIEQDDNDNSFILDNSNIYSSSSSITESTSLNNNTKNKTTSAVWNFMYKQYNSLNEVIGIVCNLCEKKYAKKTSTRPLMDHLIKEHNDIITIKNQSQRPYDKDDNRRIKECTDAVINFIIGFQMPFSVVGNIWFKELCNVFDSRYTLPTCQSLQNQIHQIFEDRRNLIAKELSELTVKVSLTADIWTSITNQAYLGVTIHYINNNWKLCHYLLDLIHLEHQHTAMRIKEKLCQLIDE